MKLPALSEVSLIIEQIEKGGSLDNAAARQLVHLIYSIMTPDHTWWRSPSIAPQTICLCYNGESITPPMVFRNEEEAEAFQDLNKTELWLPIPKPPGLKV